MTGIQNFVKENIGILMSVLDSVWSIVRGNMSIILTIFTELFYVVLMSGSAVLNFVLSTVCNVSLEASLLRFSLEERCEVNKYVFRFTGCIFHDSVLPAQLQR